MVTNLRTIRQKGIIANLTSLRLHCCLRSSTAVNVTQKSHSSINQKSIFHSQHPDATGSPELGCRLQRLRLSPVLPTVVVGQDSSVDIVTC